MEYFQSIIITLASCHLFLLAATEIFGEHTKKILRFLCGLIVLLTLYSPVKQFITNMEEFLPQVLDNMTVSAETESVPDAHEVQASEIVYGYIADKWLTHITENYPVRREQICIRLQTDTENNIYNAEIILKNCPYTIRRKIESEMTELAEIPVKVKGE